MIPIALASLLMLSGCQSKPSICECKEKMIEGLADSFSALLKEGDAKSEELATLLEKCEEVYGEMTAEETLKELANCKK